MYGQTNHEAVKMMLRNPILWNEGVINKKLRRFKLTPSDTMKKDQAEKKMRLDVRSLSDFTLPGWVR